MRIQIRSCCCALHTFVRILCILMILSYLMVSIVSFIVYGVSNSSQDLVRNRSFVIMFILSLVFCSMGIGVNVLVLLAIAMNKRMLMLPWLVFKMMLIIGLFVLGIYIALHFTILSEANDESFSRAYAVFSFFPMVFAIFLVFLWILVDQLFIQMKTIKKLGIKTISASNLSQFRSNISYNNESVRSLKSIKSIRSVPSFKKNANLKPRRSKSSNSERKPPVFRIPEPMGYNSQSLPRPKHRRIKSKPNLQDPKYTAEERKQIKRAKSLEHMLDSASSSSIYSATNAHHLPHLWLNKGKRPMKRRVSSLKDTKSTSPKSGGLSPVTTSSSASSSTVSPIPPPTSYCTIDRARLNKRAANNTEAGTQTIFNPSSQSFMQVQTLPRKPRRQSVQTGTLSTKKRSRSVDLLRPEDGPNIDRDPASCEQAIEDEFRVPNRGNFASTPYIGDCGIDELKRISSEHVLEGRTPSSNKSVTIHPDVTEFHYQDESHSSLHDKFSIEDIDDLPLPPPPLEAWLPEPIYPAPHESKSWLSKLAPKPKPGFTKNQIIDLYCQAGDVQL